MNPSLPLKLPRLPDRVPVKLTITIEPQLNRQLAAYAELYREAYGEDEPVATLIPFILADYLRGDRGLKRRIRGAGR